MLCQKAVYSLEIICVWLVYAWPQTEGMKRNGITTYSVNRFTYVPVALRKTIEISVCVGGGRTHLVENDHQGKHR